MTFGLLSFLGGRVPLSGNLNISVPSSAPTGNSFMTVSASGGTVTTSGDYKIIAFYGSGTMNVQSLGIDTVYGSTVEIMMVGGGGGGGLDMGGGGGAGGYYACTSFKVFQTEYTVTVGSGGAAAVNDNGTTTQGDAAYCNRPGSNGTSSIISSPFGTWEVLGGGGGASRHNSTTNYAGSLGSGGGASGSQGNYGIAFRGILFGYNGGTSGGQWHPGGGGGAGQRGSNGAEAALVNGPGMTNNNAPNGGRGVLNSILGPAYYWCGGGGGGGYTTYGGNGGVGGGGGGGQAYYAQNYGLGGIGAINNGTNGTQASPIATGTGNGWSGGPAGQYSGGGGGGTAHRTTNVTSGTAGNGGSGIVVIKYKFQ